MGEIDHDLGGHILMRERQQSGGYKFPPGLRHNLLWFLAHRFRPGDPIALFQHLADEFGDIAHYKIGPNHILFLNNPEYIREVLVVQNDNFVKERTVQRTRMLLGEGMITAEGRTHRVQRTAAQPAFHRQRISHYAGQIVNEAAKTRDSWRDGEEVDASKEMMGLTLRIVAQTLFSSELGVEVEELTGSINEIMGLYHYLIVLPRVELLVRLGVPGIRRFGVAKRKLDRAVHRMISAHRGHSGDSEDLLDMMIRAGDPPDGVDPEKWLRDQVITIFLAGYETVANALIWTWYLLSQNAHAEETLHAELDSVLNGRDPRLEDVANLPYTEAVLAESMRLYPPAWAMGRRALNDFSIGEYRMPAGTTVLMCQYVTQRDPKNFEYPLAFRPERFLPKGRATFPKFSYFPFGAGPRQCIGEAFAWTEAILAIATLAQSWRLELMPGQRIEPQPLITLRSKFGLRMRAQRRQPVSNEDRTRRAGAAQMAR